MRLVVWNCHQALERKISELVKLQPDIAIIPECADPKRPKLANALEKLGVANFAWNGTNEKKGLGVFFFNESIIINNIETIGGKVSIKIDLKNKEEVSLIGMWTQGPLYVEEAHRTVDIYREILAQKNVIFAGDFNSNKIWDFRRKLNHTALVNKLAEEFKLFSIYHKYFDEQQGLESRPTFCLTYNEKKPYHIDYIFLPEKWLPKVRSVEIGEFKNWKHLSDHCPMIVDIDI